MLSVWKPSFAVVAIRTPDRKISTLGAVAPLQVRSARWRPLTLYPVAVRVTLEDGAVTATGFEVDPVAPSSSVTVSVTV
jgi:hypothetical protein